jgi:hypothetical protein
MWAPQVSPGGDNKLLEKRTEGEYNSLRDGRSLLVSNLRNAIAFGGAECLAPMDQSKSPFC